MFETALPAVQQQLCLKLSRTRVVRTFFLGGGTAAALHLGHRESVDFDFFRPKPFAPDLITRPLERVAECRWDQYERNTVIGFAFSKGGTRARRPVPGCVRARPLQHRSAGCAAP